MSFFTSVIVGDRLGTPNDHCCIPASTSAKWVLLVVLFVSKFHWLMELKLFHMGGKFVHMWKLSLSGKP